MGRPPVRRLLCPHLGRVRLRRVHPGRVRPEALESVRGALPPEILRDDDAEVERWAQMLGFDTWSGPDGRDAQYAAVWEWLEDDHRMALLREVTVPTLVVAFEHDLQFPPRSGRRAAAAIPRGEFAQVPGAAHAGAFTHSKPVCEAILQFLQRC